MSYEQTRERIMQTLRGSKPITTPWGIADSVERYGPHVTCYATESHGGFHVSEELNRHIPDYLQHAADPYCDGTQGWYDEDCGWAIVVTCFPGLFPPDKIKHAAEIMEAFYPCEYARYLRDLGWVERARRFLGWHRSVVQPEAVRLGGAA